MYLLWLVVQLPVLSNEAEEKFETCCGENGICSHEVLLDGEHGNSSNAGKCKLSKKVRACKRTYNCYLTSTKILYSYNFYMDLFFIFIYVGLLKWSGKYGSCHGF